MRREKRKSGAYVEYECGCNSGIALCPQYRRQPPRRGLEDMLVARSKDAEMNEKTNARTQYRKRPVGHLEDGACV
jgi:hypothetical protein